MIFNNLPRNAMQSRGINICGLHNKPQVTPKDEDNGE